MFSFSLNAVAQGNRMTPEAFLSKDLQTVVSLDRKALRIINVPTGAVSAFPIGDGGGEVMTTRSNPTSSGDRIAIQYYSRNNNFIQLHNLDSQLSVIHKFNTPAEMPLPRFLHLSPDGKFLVLETAESAITMALVLDASSGRPLSNRIALGRSGLLEARIDPTSRYILFYNHSYYAVVELSSGTVMFEHDLETGGTPEENFMKSLNAASFNTDGSQIYLLFYPGWVSRDVKTGNKVLSFLNGTVGTCSNHFVNAVVDTNSVYIRSCGKYSAVKDGTIRKLNFPRVSPVQYPLFIAARQNQKEIYRVGCPGGDSRKISLEVYDESTLGLKKILTNLPGNCNYPTSVSDDGRYWFFSFHGQSSISRGAIYDLDLESVIFQW
jgi:hypothetical protein